MPHRKGFADLVKEYFKDSNRYLYGIEIGCWRGEFCHYLLDEFQNLRMTTIDPSPLWPDIFETRRNLERLWIINLTSDLAFDLLKKEGKLYDFVFIDGDHSYEQCKKDIMNYRDLVKAGGIIGGHNYHKAGNSAHPGVHQAVDEIFPNAKLQPDFIWYTIK